MKYGLGVHITDVNYAATGVRLQKVRTRAWRRSNADFAVVRIQLSNPVSLFAGLREALHPALPLARRPDHLALEAAPLHPRRLRGVSRGRLHPRTAPPMPADGVLLGQIAARDVHQSARLLLYRRGGEYIYGHYDLVHSVDYL
jgi:hypothetical protein